MNKTSITSVNDTLFESARSLGMCRDGVNEWPSCKSFDELCEHYFDGIEFIINHPGWPDNKWLVDTIGKKVLEANGIFIDAPKVNVGNPRHAVFNGCCNGLVTCSGFSTPVLYLRNGSNIEVSVSDAAIVHIEVYDNARLTVHCSEFAKVNVYQYGGYVHSDGEGKVLIRDKRNPRIQDAQ